MSLISTILFLPLCGVFILLFVPNWKIQLIRRIALNTSLLTFLISLLLWIEFDSGTARFQFLETWTGTNSTLVIDATSDKFANLSQYSFSGLNFLFGVDGISLFFIILTTFLIPVCILVSWTSIQAYVKEYCIAFLVLESLMIAVFSIFHIVANTCN